MQPRARASMQGSGEVSISDASGRSVFSGQLWGPSSSTPNQLINWNCTVHDQYDSATASIVASKASSVDMDENQTHSLNNGFGQSIASVDQLGNMSTRKCDSGGKTLKSINALNHETVMTYDDLGRQLTTTDPMGNSRSNTYDARGRVTASIDRLGKTTSKTYDLEGRQLSITDAQNKQTTYVYNLLGQRAATTLPDGSARGMAYDAAGRLTRTDLASGKSKTNIYTDGANDITGLLRKVEYRNAANAVGGIDTFTYDALLRRIGSASRDTSSALHGSSGRHKAQHED